MISLSNTFFHVHETGLTDTLTVRAVGDVALKHGDTIRLSPRMGELHRFDEQGMRIS